MSGERIHAVVIGGGTVATRKILTLLEAGATVRVISPELTTEIHGLSSSGRIVWDSRRYGGPEDLTSADLVFAATSSGEVNEKIAADAKEMHRLVDVVSDGEKGTFASMAMHRDGRFTIAVSAGGSPRDAMRVRDEIAALGIGASS